MDLEATAIRELLEATVTAVSLLGGAMASTSGFWAAQALEEGANAAFVAQRVNEGIGRGFDWGAPVAVLAFLVVLWS